jgi:hypothetical protein
MKLEMILFLPIVLLFLLPDITAQEPNWYGKLKAIEPLRSTRNDVENLFSAPKIRKELTTDGIRTVFYTDRAGKFTVEYSLGTCATINDKGYRANASTVLRIIYFPKVPPPFSRFNLAPDEFVQMKQGDDPGWHYVSIVSGYDIGVQLNHVDFVERVPRNNSPTNNCE